MEKRAFVFFNGVMDWENSYYKKLLENEKNIYCADGGTKYALDMGVVPLEIWGDLDSLDKSYIEKAKELNVKILKFNADKDFTDGELIVKYLSEKGFDKIYILGGLGGRTDHFLTNLNIVFKYDNVIFLDEKEIIFRVEDGMEIKNRKNHTISFIPMSSEVNDIYLKGFKYPLNGYNLKLGESICNSNVIVEDLAKIRFSSGKLLGVLQKF